MTIGNTTVVDKKTGFPIGLNHKNVKISMERVSGETWSATDLIFENGESRLSKRVFDPKLKDLLKKCKEWAKQRCDKDDSLVLEEVQNSIYTQKIGLFNSQLQYPYRFLTGANLEGDHATTAEAAEAIVTAFNELPQREEGYYFKTIPGAANREGNIYPTVNVRGYLSEEPTLTYTPKEQEAVDNYTNQNTEDSSPAEDMAGKF